MGTAGRVGLLTLFVCLLAQPSPGAAPPPAEGFALTHVGTLPWRPEVIGTHALAFSPDGRTIAVAPRSRNGPGLTLWETASQRVRASSDSGGRPAGILAFQSGRRILLRSSGGLLACEVPTFRVVESVTPKLLRDDGHFMGLVLSPDGKRLMIKAEKTPVLWDRARGRREGELIGFKVSTMAGVRYSCAAFSPDGRTVATGAVPFVDGAVNLWDAATRRHKAALPTPIFSHSTVLAFSPCGRYLAVGAMQTFLPRVHVYDLRTGELALRLWCHDDVNRLAFSPDGSLLVAGIKGRNDPVLLGPQWGWLQAWAMPSGRSVLNLLTRHNEVCGLAFSPDGSLLAVGGGEGLGTDLYRVPGVTAPAPAGKAGRPDLPAPPPALLAEWARLADPDARKAGLAVYAIAERPRQAAALAAAKLRPAPPADRAAVVRPEGADGPLTDPERLREVRAVEALELSGDGDAKAVLAWLAGGDPDARLTREARWSLHRLSRRPGAVAGPSK